MDEERSLMSCITFGSAAICIRRSKRTLVVSAGLGCIPMMKVELTAENKPAKVRMMFISPFPRESKVSSYSFERLSYVVQNFELSPLSRS